MHAILLKESQEEGKRRQNMTFPPLAVEEKRVTCPPLAEQDLAAKKQRVTCPPLTEQDLAAKKQGVTCPPLTEQDLTAKKQRVTCLPLTKQDLAAKKQRVTYPPLTEVVQVLVSKLFVLFIFVFDCMLFVLTAKCVNGDCCHRHARKWISCDRCEQWFHCVCVNISSKRTLIFCAKSVSNSTLIFCAKSVSNSTIIEDYVR